MKNIGKKLILISFILAVITAVVVFVYLKSLKTSKAVIKETTLLIAAETIPPRTIIEKKMIKEIKVSDNTIFGDYIKDSSNIVGKYTKETILKNEGFHKDKIINELKDDLTFKIKYNHRAISINVNGASGVSDLIKQGDFVDVVVYLSEKKENQKVVRPDLAKIILQNVEVLAIDKAIYANTKQREEVPNNYLVTLSVPISNIENLVLAEDTGIIKLVLRPLKSNEVHKSDGTIWRELPQPENNTSVDVKPNDKPVVSTDGSKSDSNKSKDVTSKIEDKTPSSNNKSSQSPPSGKQYVYYRIKKGDTLRKISKAFYGDPEKYVLIKELNGIKDENKIEAGTNIKVEVTQ